MEAKMKCPHCLVFFKGEWGQIDLGEDSDGVWRLSLTQCPACDRLVVMLRQLGTGKLTGLPGPLKAEVMVRPRGPAREPLSPDILSEFTKDYLKACLVLCDSPEASAALSRRCLQHLLREKAGIRPGTLDSEIQQVLDSKSLPSILAEALDAVRTVGNFAAHPMKSTNTGEVIDVEPGEAEWLLSTLEGLFDFYFVQPAIQQRKREALNVKLKEAGKPPLK
jgi:hypothetical protein